MFFDYHLKLLNIYSGAYRTPVWSPECFCPQAPNPSRPRSSLVDCFVLLDVFGPKGGGHILVSLTYLYIYINIIK